jgi:hypothetical protein
MKTKKHLRDVVFEIKEEIDGLRYQIWELKEHLGIAESEIRWLKAYNKYLMSKEEEKV